LVLVGSAINWVTAGKRPMGVGRILPAGLDMFMCIFSTAFSGQPRRSNHVKSESI
jgi:hypothetical protein